LPKRTGLVNALPKAVIPSREDGEGPRSRKTRRRSTLAPFHESLVSSVRQLIW
jgi:hypothetical protein